jgi:membrane fusion protein, heavy metal efflux system
MKFKLYKNFAFIAILSLQTIACSGPSTESADSEVAAATEEPQVVHEGTLDKNDHLVFCNGRVEVPPQYRADMHAKIDGYLENLKVLKGQKIKKGEVLATLVSKDLITLQNALLQSKARLTQLEKDQARKTELAASNAISGKELEKINADLQQEKAVYNSALAQIKFVGLNTESVLTGNITNQISVVSPIDGFVNQVNANNGRYVTANELMFQIVDESHKHIELEVFSKDAAKIQENQKVRFKQSGSTKVYEGSVFLVNRALDNISQTVNVHVHPFDNAKDLVISMFVEATIYTDTLVEADHKGH